MDVCTDVFLSKKIKRLLAASGEEPGALIERALNRRVAQIPHEDRRVGERRTNLHLVKGWKP